MENVGKNGLIFGGVEKPVKISLVAADIKTNLHNATDIDTYAKDEDFTVINGRCRFMVNDRTIERKVSYDTGWNK